mgnify:CR=1 FL=1
MRELTAGKRIVEFPSIVEARAKLPDDLAGVVGNAADEFAEALHRALSMPAEEQEQRMRRMRTQIQDNNIYRWAGMLLSEAAKLADGKAEDALFDLKRAAGSTDPEVYRLMAEADDRLGKTADADANRRWYLNRGVDAVRNRFGWNAVFYGRGLVLRRHYATKPSGLVLSTPCLSR